MRRLTDPGGFGTGKLTDTHVLRDLRGRHALLALPDARHFDVTHLSAAAVAAQIAGLVARRWQ